MKNSSNMVQWQNLPKYSFNAKELDEETGMYYFEARYYRAPTFTSRDPLFEKYPSISPYAYCANNPVKYVDPDGRDWYETENSETKQKEIKWTDYKSQSDMDAAGVKGTYLGEAFVHFEGSKEEKVGEDGTLTGKGAVAAKVTIYGIRNKDDIKTYNGMTTPKSGDYSTLNEGDYHAEYQDMATSVYGEKGAKAKGIATALTYRISSLNGTPLKGTKKGENVTMIDVFLHRTDWNGKASNSSKGCPIIDGRSWRDVEKQLGHSSNIHIRITR